MIALISFAIASLIHAQGIDELGRTMVYLLIVVVVMTIVASVIAVLPSKRQRQLAKMRMKATQLGLRCQFLNESERDQFKNLPADKTLIWYQFNLAKRRPANKSASAAENPGQGILLLGDDLESSAAALTEGQTEILQQIFSQLEGEVFAVKLTDAGVSCLWHESDQLSDVAFLADKLKAMSDFS